MEHATAIQRQFLTQFTALLVTDNIELKDGEPVIEMLEKSVTGENMKVWILFINFGKDVELAVWPDGAVQRSATIILKYGGVGSRDWTFLAPDMQKAMQSTSNVLNQRRIETEPDLTQFNYLNRRRED